ncbi:MAG: class I SAM-dependent methyltransferase [Myxococcota bacterium]
MLTARYEEGEYLRKVPDWHAADAPWKAGKVFQLLEKHQLAPQTVCDVGCGAGEILAQLQPRLRRGARLTGYDISSQAIALCKAKENAHLTFHQRDFAREGREVFDLLLALDVFEHVADYLGFLAAVRERARWFIFHIPLDVSSQAVARGSRHLLHMRRQYGHLHYFTAETAQATLIDTGYLVEDACYTWDGELDHWPLHPWRCLTYGLERLAFRLAPGLTARLRPAYNLLVLAKARTT